MPIETKQTARALNPTRTNGKGVVSSKNITVPNTEVVVSVPDDSRYFVVKNIGNSDLYLNFNADLPTDHYPLLKNERTPTIEIIDTTTIRLRAKSSSTEAVLLVWG